ncbi:MAG: magnesium/cobalt transporter CorA [Armatimonadota bacterium]|nr:magnesium/cobalt transporter CorA [Armatimonadota bacterium]
MFRITAYHPNKGVQIIKNIAQISDFIADPETIVWLDAMNPSKEEMEKLALEFGFHPLAIDDYFTPHHRPKVDEYPGYLFLVSHFVTYNPKKEDVRPIELDIFVGKNYIVTLHKQELTVLHEVADRWSRHPQAFVGGVGLLLYDILDALVDSYFPILDQIDERLDQIETSIFKQEAAESPERIFRLKRTLLVLRRIATPLRDMFNILTRRDQPLLSEQAVTYLRDIYDHTLRIVDTIDTYRDILASALDAYLTVISNQLNAVMKSLTVAATVLISVGLVAAIYGMNFRYMPELTWRYGYPYALGLMALIGVVLLYYFRRIKWL